MRALRRSALLRPRRAGAFGTGAAPRVASVRWAAAGLLVGALLALAAFAPATWLAAALAARSGQRLLLSDARGTVWNGNAVAVLSGGADSRSAAQLPGRVHWRIGVHGLGLQLSLFQPCCMAEAARLQMQAGPRRLQLQLAPGSAAGSHSLAEWPAAWLAGLGAPWNTLQLGGTLQLSSPGLQLEIADGRWSVAGQAELRLANVSSPLTSLPRLGSYVVRLDADADADVAGTPRFVLGTLDGALQLEGRGQWTGSHWRFRGQARAAPGAQSELDNLLNFFGRRQGALSLISIG